MGLIYKVANKSERICEDIHAVEIKSTCHTF